jgi:hypothetical protein
MRETPEKMGKPSADVISRDDISKYSRFPAFPAMYLVTKKRAPNDGALT